MDGSGATGQPAELAMVGRGAELAQLESLLSTVADTGIPYLAFADAFRRVADSPLRPDEAGGQLRLFQRVRGSVARMAQVAPLVLILEDVHWADTSTLDLVSFLARMADDDPVPRTPT